VQNVRVLTSRKQREDACELPKHFVQIAGNVSVVSRTLGSAQMRKPAGFEKLARPDRLYRQE
jgi:hypothetical protein